MIASQESILSASTAGRVSRVPVGLGDNVRAGQVVASFDCAEMQARRDAARAEHEAARVQYEAKLKLQGLQSAAEVEVELAAANVNKAQSQIRIFDAQVAHRRVLNQYSIDERASPLAVRAPLGAEFDDQRLGESVDFGARRLTASGD